MSKNKAMMWETIFNPRIVMIKKAWLFGNKKDIVNKKG
jgi:hypothetical protein